MPYAGLWKTSPAEVQNHQVAFEKAYPLRLQQPLPGSANTILVCLHHKFKKAPATDLQSNMAGSYAPSAFHFAHIGAQIRAARYLFVMEVDGSLVRKRKITPVNQKGTLIHDKASSFGV
eukprot:TRINITY_DN41207_c0_g1_i2.p2 TRINITY_DN41207_c0_g1~~TRINITY_DN41207_c0_g1_i2.p2  ORF type:complete len:119 (+),score=10.67 TRINITY_DN41207_c0_g1_i2:255-611(+)